MKQKGSISVPVCFQKAASDVIIGRMTKGRNTDVDIY
jgi:hypothetical protein